MLNRPYFKPCYSVKTIEPDNVFFLSEKQITWLSDRLCYRLASLIDGHRNIDEIIEIIQLELLKDQKSFETTSLFFQNALDITIKAQHALLKMEKQGYLVEQDESLPSHLAIFCNHLNISPAKAYQRLQLKKVAVKAYGSLHTEDFIAILKSLHIQVADEGNLTIVLTDDYLDQNLDKFNQQALQSSSPWMLVNPLGTKVCIGPLFYPNKSACWECLAHRLRDNRPIEGFIQRHQNISSPLPPPLGFLHSTMQTALGMAATEIFKWIVQGENQQLTGKLLTYDTLTFQTQEHSLVKRPQCPSCGEIVYKFTKKPLPVVLGHSKKTFTADGGHRSCSPQETLSRHQHHISPITGVVRELNKIPGNELIHTYVAKHHFLNTFDDLTSLRQNLQGRSAGKGRTDLQARASGLCEAIERYSGVFQGDEIREKASYHQMGDKAIHPNTCMNFSEQQYQTREQWNLQCENWWFQKVPEPFDPDREIDWTPVWSLTNQEFKYLPTAYCYYGYLQPHQPDCWADSNGSAAGNTLEEAILQGFMELVERDSVALWWYNRLKKPQVDIESFDEPYFLKLKQYYQNLNRELSILDITSDLNIPTFAAITYRTDREVEDIVLGYGSHFDPKIAISRALTEVNQILPHVLSVKADGSTKYPSPVDPLALKWWKTATLANQPYLVPDENMPAKVYADYRQLASDDFLDDIKLCQKIVENNGLELLVLDQTRPDIGLRVAKVIVPGMRHMWNRLGSGRLYEVPVKMGWLKKPLTENQLNPIPMWM
ncbi:TOMM precursor leader peptide-binding protein [Aetokthonos hydrillicola Thurmond2011]|jgi:ribosomal protein S12 methylthiotransferase accessory factor|uniref:TOMM leader peptide-binding protein n=1 Tax=Aetokthonos hydrillicola Thurmond2011 TaxID=2712845 RepID=A0AAP5MA33_9CYAN|nr:TOMM precursor leader peptide-binding protein [Aetokthonos hydrillicola]MBO3459800.1 TOMM precursor leader peptide-binding protein [Aetokthonos hydrillicola CCALA 1050]MBW4584555.1 TOMM precursor leader peptide-binding protein [Aetokthonos hydrillicola CCALA 1050]MDR9895099.1 TOMM precursor leader peptide-binding protein [Aetokthonos hydrillicola Thurmond2011]